MKDSKRNAAFKSLEYEAFSAGLEPEAL